MLKLTGTIRFEGGTPSGEGATVFVRLLDTGRADASSRPVLELVMRGVSLDATMEQGLPYAMSGPVRSESARYDLSVLVDLDGDGETSRGDYITMESHPVSATNPESQVAVRVRRVE